LSTAHYFSQKSCWRALVLIAAVSLGLNLLQAQQRIVAWGDNSFGQTNVPDYQCVPDIKAIAAGYYHCLALRSNGTVIAWGDTSQGQTNIPPTVTNVMAIAAGNYHSLALRSNGSVVAWAPTTLVN